MSTLKVTLVSTWDIPCGISEHSAYLKAAIEAADPNIQIGIEVNLHPNAVLAPRIPIWEERPDWMVLNYHAALHSQWHPEHVRHVQAQGSRVLVVYHDTGIPNSDQCLALHAVADAFIIHEPAQDLPGAIYLRQGIPDWATLPIYVCKGDGRSLTGGRCPVVGTIGFPFSWKNYDLLLQGAALAGWGVLLIAPGATLEQQVHWHDLNPEIRVIPEFTPRNEAVALLSGCDATAFLYANANTGTSGAIRQGIATRKPVIATALGICRQFTDLYLDAVGHSAIRWMNSLGVEDVAEKLASTLPLPFDPAVVRLAHQDSWATQGARYAQILRGLV